MKYTLKLSKWVNGDSIGRGESRMLNEQGFSCCLGQFAMQVGVDEEKLKNAICPGDVGNVYDSNFVMDVDDDSGPEPPLHGHTALAMQCMKINDEKQFKGRRVESLRKVLEAAGHELEVVE